MTTTESARADRLLLLDGHSLAYRAFHALPAENFTTTSGQTTNAVYGFTSMLINALRDEDPTHIAVAFDVSRRTFRTEEYADYKATRSATPPEFKGQVELLKEVLDALGITHVAVDGYEADDVIATLAAQAGARAMGTWILTGDRDSFQLVDRLTTVLYPRKGVSDLARMDPAAVEEKYGVTPEQYADFAALRGDSSDNLPGIPGVGEKTAARWIKDYGSITGLVEHADEITGKVGDALRAALPQVLLNRRLTELVRSVPLPCDIDALCRRPIDRQRAEEVFDALQFRVLRDRLFASLPADSRDLPGAGPEVDAHEIPTGGWGAWLTAHADAPCAVAVGGTWGRGTGQLTAVSVASADGACAWSSAAALDNSDEQAISLWLADPARTKVMHDAKGPLLAALDRGWALDGLVADTALSAYLVLPGQRSFDLGELAQRFLGRSMASPTSSSSHVGQLPFDDDVDGAHLCAEAVTARDVSRSLTAEIEARGAARLLAEVELPLLPLLARMERSGIAVDLPGLRTLSEEFGTQQDEAEREAHLIAGRPFTLGSPKQLQEVLFTERGLPTTKRIKTGYTTDAEALRSLFERTHDPLVAALLRWRDWSRLRQSVDGLIPLADSAGRIHTTFNQMVAATGRLSSTDPNLQNIPVRTESGRRIRRCFVPGEGFDGLLTADYSQIEMRIMAHLSGDEGLISAFASGEDLHTTVASRVFAVDPSDVDAEMRRRTKAMSYGLAYGLSAFGLAEQLGIEPAEARSLMDEYFARFGGVRDYLQQLVDQARKTGYTETILGRRRYLPDLTSDNRQRREMAERMALNAPIQGSAADIIKVAMLRVDAGLREAGLSSRLILQVHDELVLEVAPGEQTAVTDVVVAGMGGAADLTVSLDVSVGYGPTWDDAAH